MKTSLLEDILGGGGNGAERALVQVCWAKVVWGSRLEVPDGWPCHLGPSVSKLSSTGEGECT